MVASNVIITAETRAKLDNPILTPSKKRNLRDEMIKDYIRSRPGGAATKQELVAAAGLNPDAKSSEYARGVAMINSLVKRKVISHNNTNSFKKSWSVLADIKQRPLVTPTPTQVAAEIVAPAEVLVELKEYTESKVKLVDMAKQFAWSNNSDSLRDFIAYIENAIK